LAGGALVAPPGAGALIQPRSTPDGRLHATNRYR
jgi:hypothetical protein